MDAEQAVGAARQGVGDALGGDRLPDGHRDLGDVQPVGARHVDEPVAEVAGARHDDPLAGLEQVEQRSVKGRAARSGQEIRVAAASISPIAAMTCAWIAGHTSP